MSLNINFKKSAVLCFENVRFSAFLNADRVPQYLISMGNAFHSRGPTTRNTWHCLSDGGGGRWKVEGIAET